MSPARDLYILQRFTNSGPLDESLIRQLWTLKLYRDFVIDGRGGKPVHPQDVLRPQNEAEFRREDIGYLTQPVRINEWIAIVRSRYDYLTYLDTDELR